MSTTLPIGHEGMVLPKRFAAPAARRLPSKARPPIPRIEIDDIGKTVHEIAPRVAVGSRAVLGLRRETGEHVLAIVQLERDHTAIGRVLAAINLDERGLVGMADLLVALTEAA